MLDFYCQFLVKISLLYSLSRVSFSFRFFFFLSLSFVSLQFLINYYVYVRYNISVSFLIIFVFLLREGKLAYTPYSSGEYTCIYIYFFFFIFFFMIKKRKKKIYIYIYEKTKDWKRKIDRVKKRRKKKNNDAPASNLCDPLLPFLFLAGGAKIGQCNFNCACRRVYFTSTMRKLKSIYEKLWREFFHVSASNV